MVNVHDLFQPNLEDLNYLNAFFLLFKFDLNYF